MEIFWLNKDPNIPLIRGRSLHRKINAALVHIQARMKTNLVWGYPRHLMIDLVNTCGLKCPICAQGRGEIPRKPAKIEESLFKSIIDRLGPYLVTLTLTNWGEPLHHPQAIAFIRYARRHKSMYIGFSTNLQMLPPDLDALLQSGIDEIGCSIDGATENTYRKYRIGGDFNRAMNNMKRLVNRKRELNLNAPRIRWQVLLNRYTENELTDIQHMAGEIGVDSVVFVPIYVDIARMFTASAMERFERDREWLPRDEGLSWYNYHTGTFKKPPAVCGKLWDSMVIHPDGSVSPCCAVIDPKDDFGIWRNGRDFWKIWNGDNYRAARRLMAGNDSDIDGIVCRRCVQNGVVIY
ncbi:radical SAM protein [bacterium]|nr:radical SAM protein [candidate division CSSED10-310 bacterium]